jgi:hypothetical protein
MAVRLGWTKCLQTFQKDSSKRLAQITNYFVGFRPRLFRLDHKYMFTVMCISVVAFMMDEPNRIESNRIESNRLEKEGMAEHCIGTNDEIVKELINWFSSASSPHFVVAVTVATIFLLFHQSLEVTSPSMVLLERYFETNHWGGCDFQTLMEKKENRRDSHCYYKMGGGSWRKSIYKLFDYFVISSYTVLCHSFLLQSIRFDSIRFDSIWFVHHKSHHWYAHDCEHVFVVKTKKPRSKTNKIICYLCQTFATILLECLQTFRPS